MDTKNIPHAVDAAATEEVESNREREEERDNLRLID